MAEIPKSWGLSTKRIADDKTAIVGKDVLGQEYVAATSDGDGVSDEALRHLALSNRETNTARDIVNRQMESQERVRRQWEDKALESYMEPADMAVRAMTERRSIGYSRVYAQNYDRVFGKDN